MELVFWDVCPLQIMYHDQYLHYGIKLNLSSLSRITWQSFKNYTNSYKNYTNSGVIDQKKADAVVKDSIQKLNIKTPSGKTLIQSLSGGNQQKVIIARWLANNPDILIMDEPTRGIDVGAKYEIYQIMIDLVKQGKSIIMISSEMPELIGMSNRIIVM